MKNERFRLLEQLDERKRQCRADIDYLLKTVDKLLLQESEFKEIIDILKVDKNG